MLAAAFFHTSGKSAAEQGSFAFIVAPSRYRMIETCGGGAGINVEPRPPVLVASLRPGSGPVWIHPNPSVPTVPSATVAMIG